LLAFIIQILLVTPLLTLLSGKVWRHQVSAKPHLMRLAVVVAVGYLVGIWINVLFKWFGIIVTSGSGFCCFGHDIARLC
jgi:hypothetical protein